MNEPKQCLCSEEAQFISFEILNLKDPMDCEILMKLTLSFCIQLET